MADRRNLPGRRSPTSTRQTFSRATKSSFTVVTSGAVNSCPIAAANPAPSPTPPMPKATSRYYWARSPKSKPDDWTDEGNGIWSAGDLTIDVGNIIFGNEETCGVKKWHKADLRRDNDYWYDKATHKVKLRSGENPAKRYGRIECAMDRHAIDESGRHYVTYENLAVKYAGAHGIGGGNTHHITVRNCDFGFIGGGELRRTSPPSRSASATASSSGARRTTISSKAAACGKIYDAALTNQSTR